MSFSIIRVEIAPGGGIGGSDEILEIVEIIIEFQEGRHPRPARIYRVLIDGTVVDFAHESAMAREMLRRVGKDSAEGWVLYDATQRQLGIYEGAIKLLDPFAVERMPFWPGR